jgi:hypothetical protein
MNLQQLLTDSGRPPHLLCTDGSLLCELFSVALGIPLPHHQCSEENKHWFFSQFCCDGTYMYFMMNDKTGLQIEDILAYFTHIKCQKCIGDDVGDVRYVFTQKIKFNKKIYIIKKNNCFYPFFILRRPQACQEPPLLNELN